TLLAGIALDDGGRINDLQFVGVFLDLDVLLPDHGDLGKNRAIGLPALAAAANMIMSSLRRDAHHDRVGRAMTLDLPAVEPGRTGLDAAVDARMNLDVGVSRSRSRLPAVPTAENRT